MRRNTETSIKTAVLAALFAAGLSGSVYAAEAPKTDTIVLAGGCFWGVESVFDHTKGVVKAVAGYAGGQKDTARYEEVSTGSTGHAESVQVTYDPQQITLSQLLDVYFKVAHDPTQLNHQGADTGTQYRSTIFYATPDQQKIVEGKIADLEAQHVYKQSIVTKLEPLKGFYPAEDYHQHYADLHPHNPYIMMTDAPRLSNLKINYPTLYKE